jgi:hypothetical protein
LVQPEAMFPIAVGAIADESGCCLWLKFLREIHCRIGRPIVLWRETVLDLAAARNSSAEHNHFVSRMLSCVLRIGPRFAVAGDTTCCFLVFRRRPVRTV